MDNYYSDYAGWFYDHISKEDLLNAFKAINNHLFLFDNLCNDKVVNVNLGSDKQTEDDWDKLILEGVKE